MSELHTKDEFSLIANDPQYSTCCKEQEEASLEPGDLLDANGFTEECLYDRLKYARTLNCLVCKSIVFISHLEQYLLLSDTAFILRHLMRLSQTETLEIL